MPSTRRVPPLSGDMHEIIRMVDVLPAPLGPRKPKDSPRAMAKSTESTATNVPKRFCRPSAHTNGWSGGPPGGPGGDAGEEGSGNWGTAG